MKTVWIFSLVAVVALVASAEQGHKQDESSSQKIPHEVNLDKFIDENQDGIKEALEAIDPVEALSRKYTFIHLLTIKLEEGWIQNLSLFHRTGVCVLRYGGKQLVLDLNVGWDNLSVDYKYLFKKVILAVTGDLHMTVYDSSINLVISFDFDTFKASLDRIRVIDARKCDLKVEGHLSDFITNILLQFFPRGAMVKEIESMARIMIQDKLDYVNENLNETLASENNPKMIQMFISSFKNFHNNTKLLENRV